MQLVFIIILLILLILYWEMALLFAVIALTLFIAYKVTKEPRQKSHKIKNKHYKPPVKTHPLYNENPNLAIKNSYLNDDVQSMELSNETPTKQSIRNHGADFDDDYLTTSSNPSVMAIWDKWHNSHSWDEQFLRRKRSLYNVTPLFIDTKNLCARYVGFEDEIYITTLGECSCMDFSKRHFPCKHMYSLFHYIEHDKNDSINLGLGNPLIISKISKLSKRGTELLFKLLRNINEDGYVLVKKSNSTVNPIIKSGLLAPCEFNSYVYADYMGQIYTKPEIYGILEKFQILEYKKSWKKPDLIKWIADNQSDLLKSHFNNIHLLTLPDEMIYYYDQWIEKYHSRNSNYD